ncbi:karrikin insensitive 2 receptor CA [Apium graveolens]|uniref:karrikin insensitive 2 receptor CA n=1 Tax=Apium graveolens TaxID=4045 RepID=UPI003D79A339
MVIMLDKSLSKAMNVTIMGSGDETIILGHGFGTDQSLWDKVIPNISDKYKVVLFDWCFSGAIKDPHFFDEMKHTSYDAFAQDLIALMEELKLESCTYVGHSMACMIGCIASIKKPQLFKKLILVGASPRYINCEGYEGGFGSSDIDQLLSNIGSIYEQWATIFPTVVMDANDPQSIEYFTKCLQRTRPEVALPVATIVFQSDERELLEKVTAPCTIIQANNDIVVPNSVAEFMSNKIKGKSSVEYVEATGHFPQLTSHLQFNEVLARVL